MKSKQQSLNDASDALAAIVAAVRDLTPSEAAERAWHRGGPSIDELELQIARAGICIGAATRSIEHRS